MTDATARSIDMLIQERGLIARALDGLGHDQLIAIPDGHKNNILWNIGHIVVVQQLLHCKLSGLPLYVTNALVESCKSATSPADWSSPPDADELRALLTELPAKLADDYAAGRFTSFNAYETSTGLTLQTLDDALSFNHFHEGVHTGIILALKKRV